MSTLAKLLVNLGLDSSDFKSGIAGAMNSASKLGSVVKGAATIAVAGFAAVGAGITAAAVPGLQFNNTMEIVTAQLNAFTKSGAKSAEILAMIKQRASATPFAFEEMAKATTSLLPAAKQSGIALEELIKKAEILAASNPAEGLEGAAFSLKEALGGDFVSIVERFNLPRQRLNELKEQGVPAMEAISIAMTEMGLDADLVSNLANTASGRWSTFKDTLVGVSATATKPIFDLLSNGLANANTWLAANQPLLDELGAILAGSISTGIEMVIDGFNKLNDVIDPVLASFQSVQDSDLGNIFQQLAPAIDSTIERFKKMADFVMVLFNQVKVFLDNNGGDIVKTFSQWTGQVIDIVNKAMVLLNTVIVATLSVVTAFIGKHGNEIQTILSGAWEVIKNVISAALNIIQGVLTAALQIISGDWTGAWETIKSMSAAVVLNLIGIITGGLNIIAGFFGSSLKGIVATWQNNWNMLLSIASTLVSRLLALLQTLPSKMVALGASVVQGIISGLSSAWGSLVSWVTSKMQSLFDEAMAAIRGGSPALLFVPVGGSIILGILKGLQDQLPQMLKWVRDVLGQKLVEFLKSAIGMARAQMDIFRTLFDLKRGSTFQPLIDATESLTSAREDALAIQNRLLDKQAEIDTLIGSPLADQVAQNQALNKLYAEQTTLLDENAAAQRLLVHLSKTQEIAQQGANAQQNQLTTIANEARMMYEAAQARAQELAKTDSKFALDFFNERKAQITELANLQRDRILSTDPAEQAMLDTQMQLLKGVIALEREQQETVINLLLNDSSKSLGEDKIVAIILETLRKAGYQVDINYRTT